jgi:hypothetical protein
MIPPRRHRLRRLVADLARAGAAMAVVTLVATSRVSVGLSASRSRSH